MSNNGNDSNNNKGEDDFFDHFCQNVRRFTDQHISSMLHSLIGLPSMVTPPAGGTWVMIDEEQRPKKERTYSDGDGRLEGKTMEEIQKTKVSWMAERDGGEGAVRVGAVEADKSKAESAGSSSSSSSTLSSAGPGEHRIINVFRFPSSSSSDGYSDFYSPDAQRQIERLHGHMLRSFYGDELFLFSPFQSLFGPLHPYMFSPFVRLPRHSYDHGYREPMEEGLDEFDQWRRIQDAELRWRRRVYGHYSNDSRRFEGEKAYTKVEGQQPLSLPASQQDAAKPEPETELDFYEHLDSILLNEKSHTSQNTVARCIAGTSTSTESRSLPDGSTFTRTVKITHYDDGTEERIENEHSTPPRSETVVRATQGNRRCAAGAEGENRNSGIVSISTSSCDCDRAVNENERRGLQDFERKMFDYLMSSLFFGEKKRRETSDGNDIETLMFPRTTFYESMSNAKRSRQDENRVSLNERDAQSNDLPVVEDNSGRWWNWFWAK